MNDDILPLLVRFDAGFARGLADIGVPEEPRYVIGPVPEYPDAKEIIGTFGYSKRKTLLEL